MNGFVGEYECATGNNGSTLVPKSVTFLSRRLDKAQRGNLGDVKPVGEGVFEMREHFGPGWRMYYVKRGKTLIVLLGGGDKGSQESDIAKAKQRESTLED